MTDRQAVALYGAPSAIWIRYTVRPAEATGSGINISCCFVVYFYVWIGCLL